MAYLGVSPSNGVRRVFSYTASAAQTDFTGSSTEGQTLSYKDTTYIDVYQNGVLLDKSDYTSTNGTTVVLDTAASENDVVVIIVYDVFSVADTVSKADGGTFDGNVTFADNTKAQFGDSQDLQIYHDGSNSYVNDAGTGSLIIEGANVQIQDTQQDLLAKFNNAGAVQLYHVDSGTSVVKLATSADGVTVTGNLIPAADDTHDLGSSSKQWRDIYTGDINLNNTKTRDNEVDGTRGSWTIQEGADDLFLLNRLNGKKYRFKLEEM